MYDVLNRECPQCGMAVGVRCRRGSGQYYSPALSHRSRFDLMERVADEESIAAYVEETQESAVVFETGKTLKEHLTEIEQEAPKPEVKEAGRIRRVRQRIKDLESALDDLSFYMTKIEAKARAYDKVQFAINGVIEDPL